MTYMHCISCFETTNYLSKLNYTLLTKHTIFFFLEIGFFASNCLTSWFCLGCQACFGHFSNVKGAQRRW